MIQRDPKYYTTGYKGQDPCESPLHLRALVFDGTEGDCNANLINEFNKFLKDKNTFSDYKIENADPSDNIPSKILVINASHDDLPTSYETARVFRDFLREKGYKIPIKVINTNHELVDEVKDNCRETLIMSQCVDKKTYNVKVAKDLEALHAVTVPGEITAPGSIFSDKDRAYQLLSDNGKHWETVAKYRKVRTENKKVEEVVEGIFKAASELEEEIGDTTFFVKPHEGGGGLGGFRITKTDSGYIIPDLSKVSREAQEPHPTFIDFDTESDAKLRELLWVYRLFEQDEEMSSNYLEVKLPISGKSDEEAVRILKDYILNSEKKRNVRLASMAMPKEEVAKELTRAITFFEEKFERRYVPLVNEHLDFGLWGLRAHYRISRKGPVLETMYHRVFQLVFTEEGLGYLGSDNISNKQTGHLEITRLGPVNEIMLEAIGGKDALFESLLKGAEGMIQLADLIPKDERKYVPLRMQFDLAAVSKRIGEGNADTARGLCLASRWEVFVENNRQWLEDALVYYAWKKSE